jgi:hypothetical protein
LPLFFRDFRFAGLFLFQYTFYPLTK